MMHLTVTFFVIVIVFKPGLSKDRTAFTRMVMRRDVTHQTVPI